MLRWSCSGSVYKLCVDEIGRNDSHSAKTPLSLRMVCGIDEPVEVFELDVTEVFGQSTLAEPDQCSREAAGAILEAVLDCTRDRPRRAIG